MQLFKESWNGRCFGRSPQDARRPVPCCIGGQNGAWVEQHRHQKSQGKWFLRLLEEEAAKIWILDWEGGTDADVLPSNKNGSS